MHTDVDYTHLPEGAKAAKALEDIKNWLGDNFEKVEATFLNEGHIPFDAFTVYCAFAGIQGYPVRVWYESLFGKQELN